MVRRFIPSRRALSWLGLVLSLFLAALWGTSRFWTIHRYDGRPGVRLWWLGIDTGCCGIGVSDSDGFGFPPGVSWHAKRRDRPMRWKAEFQRFSGSFLVLVPLWVPFVALAVPTTLSLQRDVRMWWRRWRRSRPGVCVACGYDLRGLPPGTACPECGHAP